MDQREKKKQKEDTMEWNGIIEMKSRVCDHENKLERCWEGRIHRTWLWEFRKGNGHLRRI